MPYYLSPKTVLKRLEMPYVYRIDTDDLYELDEESLAFLAACGEDGCDSVDREFLSFCVDEGILIGEPAPVRRPPLTPSPVPSLRYLELQITDRCNLSCRHCYIDSGSRSELGFDRIRMLLAEFEEMQGLRLLISGGEPLLHSDFPKLNEMLPRFLFRKVLFTNGLLLTDRLLDTLSVDEIQVSVDGMENAHDALRGKGTWKKAITALRRAAERGFSISVATMVHAKNLGDFEQMDTFFRELGAREWTVDVPCSTGRLVDHPDLTLSPSVAGAYLGYGYGGGIHGSTAGFGCGCHLMAVTAGGKAAKCTFYADRPLGTVEDGLRACWSRLQPVRLTELSCDCSFLESCRGGCRYRAELSGDRLGRDPYRCGLYGIIENKTA